MSETYYEVFCDSIRPVEVIKVTEKTITLASGKRRNREGWASFYPTWKDAHDGLIADLEKNVAQARRSLEYANSKLGNAKGMKPPSTPITSAEPK